MKRPLRRKADDRGRVNLGAEYSGKTVELRVERDFDVDELPVKRAVHFFSPGETVRAQLYAGSPEPNAESLFGIHWNTGPVWHRDAYAGHDNQQALSDYNAMNDAHEGSLIAAYYGAKAESVDEDNELDNYLVIGICPPHSTVRAVPFENDNGGLDFVKALPLVNTVEVSRDEHPDLFEGNVPGHSVYNTKDEPRIREIYDAKTD